MRELPESIREFMPRFARGLLAAAVLIGLAVGAGMLSQGNSMVVRSGAAAQSLEAS